MNKKAKILIVGHGDLIESSLYNYFKTNGYESVYSTTTLALNPSVQASVYHFFSEIKPEYVFLASTRSGGIEVNRQKPAEFLYHNLESQNNVLYAAEKFGVKKLLYYGASCVYPKECQQPMKEEYLLTGELEETSVAYSIAKIAGIKLCQAFRKQYNFNAITMIPATVYGPGADSDIKTAHVMGALIGKFVAAVEDNEKEVVVWGSGEARREFLYVDDFILVSLFLMDKYNQEEIINIGVGSDVSIKQLSTLIAEACNFKGQIKFDNSKPEGAKQKLLDNSRITKLGWRASVSIKDGIKKTVESFIKS